MEKDQERQLIYNAVECPDGTILESFSRHDCKRHKGYLVDGGLDYQRIGTPNRHFPKNLAQYLSNDHEHNHRWLHWGHYGPNGDEPLTYVPVEKLAIDHIEAILRTQPQLDQWRKDILVAELKYRREPSWRRV